MHSTASSPDYFLLHLPLTKTSTAASRSSLRDDQTWTRNLAALSFETGNRIRNRDCPSRLPSSRTISRAAGTCEIVVVVASGHWAVADAFLETNRHLFHNECRSGLDPLHIAKRLALPSSKLGTGRWSAALDGKVAVLDIYQSDYC